MPRILPAQVADLYADHCYMRASGCTGSDTVDPGWSAGLEDWGLEANLAWLHGYVDG